MKRGYKAEVILRDYFLSRRVLGSRAVTAHLGVIGGVTKVTVVTGGGWEWGPMGGGGTNSLGLSTDCGICRPQFWDFYHF